MKHDLLRALGRVPRWILVLVLGLIPRLGLAADQIPTIQGLDLQRVGAASLSEVYRGTWQGAVWYFKRPLPGSRIYRTPNFEAEWIVGALRRELDLPTPEVQVVRFGSKEGPFLATQGVVPGVFDPGPVRSLKDCQEGAPRHPVRLCPLLKLLFLDLITGNGDRHPGNLLLTGEETGSYTPIPIDNDLALATPQVVRHYVFMHFLPSFRGGKAVTPEAGTRDFVNPMLSRRSGRALSIALANPLYRNLWSRSELDPERNETLYRSARAMVERLSDRVLDTLVASAPPEFFQLPNPPARREEILAILKRRRDLLPTLFHPASRRLNPEERGALKVLEKAMGGPPESLLDLSPRALQALGRRLAHELIRSPDPESLYAHLRDLGVPPRGAEHAVLALTRSLELDPFQAGSLEESWRLVASSPVGLTSHTGKVCP